MTYAIRAVDDLVVNRDNDRHGPMESEAAAFAWLLAKKADHMKRLAADIVAAGKVYEPPLIRQEEEGWIVYDGNRRVASLKLLLRPGLAPTSEWTRFYQQLADGAAQPIPSELECRIEQDGELIDEILYRRHTGSQNGVGQSQWDATAKHNFVERTGKGGAVNIAREIFSTLKRDGYPRPLHQIPISNANRLLSAESQRNRVGLSLRKNTLSFTHEPGAAMRAISRIFDDLSSGHIVLADVWDAESKTKYLNKLDAEGLLPNVKFALKTPITIEDWLLGSGEADEDDQEIRDESDTPSQDESESAEDPPEPQKRLNLIPSDVHFNLPKTPEMTRIRAIWDDLQFNLRLSKHINAISVLHRVLIELSVTHYLNKVGETTYSNASWSEKMKAALNHQMSTGAIDSEYEKIVRRFQRSEEVLSSSSMIRSQCRPLTIWTTPLQRVGHAAEVHH